MGRRIQKAIYIVGIVLFAMSPCGFVVAEEGPKEMYKSAYKSLVAAEIAQKGEEKEQTASKWSEALKKLGELQKAHPDWNRMIVESKIKDCEAILAKIKEGKVSPSEEGEKPVAVKRPLPELEEHLRKGNGLVMEKKYDEAIEEFEKALGVDPNCAVAYLNIATCYEYQDKDDDAVRMLKKALQADSSDDTPHFRLGGIYLKKDMLDMAVFEYKKGLEAKPDDPVAHWEIAGMYFKIKKLDDSIKHYDRAAELFGETTPEGLEAIRNSVKIKLLKREMGIK